MKYLNPYLLKRAAAPIPFKVLSNLLRRSHSTLRSLYHGTTRLPMNPKFLHSNTRKLLNAFNDRMEFAPVRRSARYTDNSSKVFYENKNPITGQISSFLIPYKLQPFWNKSEKILNRLKNGKLTNRQLINLQTGDRNYYNELMDHLDGISAADARRAGIWIAPKANRLKFGRKQAIKPTIYTTSPNGQPNAYYYPSKGTIDVQSVDPFAQLDYSFKSQNMFSPAYYAVPPNSQAGTAAMALHEENHSHSIPIFKSLNTRSVPYKHPRRPVRTINTVPVDDNIIYSSINAELRQGYGAFRPDIAAKIPMKWFGKNGSVKGSKIRALGANRISANPIHRRNMLLPSNGRYMTGEFTGSQSPFHYAYDADEMTQGLISLNRTQSLLQHAIRRNPQAYIKAGFSPKSINEFLNLPKFLKSPAMLDQRMEFYARHPEYMNILGDESSRIIPRYFMLERERFNPDMGQNWRDLHQDLFEFIRSNYFLASAVPPVAAAPVVYGQMMNNDPGNTGMGRYMSNTAIG